MRESSFSSVDFPAPLRPMMPTVSPRLISNETSRSAQSVDVVSAAAGRNFSMSASRIVVAPAVVPDLVRLAEIVDADRQRSGFR